MWPPTSGAPVDALECFEASGAVGDRAGVDQESCARPLQGGCSWEAFAIAAAVDPRSPVQRRTRWTGFPRMLTIQVVVSLPFSTVYLIFHQPVWVSPGGVLDWPHVAGSGMRIFSHEFWKNVPPLV